MFNVQTVIKITILNKYFSGFPVLGRGFDLGGSSEVVAVGPTEQQLEQSVEKFGASHQRHFERTLHLRLPVGLRRWIIVKCFSRRNPALTLIEDLIYI